MDVTSFAVTLATLIAIYGLLAIGLNVQFGYTGVLNFGYVAFFAIGAFTSAWLTLPVPGSDLYVATYSHHEIGFELPYPIGLGGAVLVAGFFGAGIGVLSLRLSGHYLAVATFAVGEIVHTVLTNEVWLSGGHFGITTVPQPGKGTLIETVDYPIAALFFALLFGSIALILVMRATGSGFGRLLRAIRDDEIAAQALGKNVGLNRLKALVLGGMVAGLAGGLWTHSLGVVHVEQFVSIITFQIWLAVLLGGRGNHWGVLLGTVLLISWREGIRFLDPGVFGLVYTFPEFLPSLRLIFIGMMLIVVIRFAPSGLLPEGVGRAPFPRARSDTGKGSVSWAAPSVDPMRYRSPIPALTITKLSKVYDHVRALNDVSFNVDKGMITGVIGPNGAGKSTLIDLISGFQACDVGRVKVFGVDVTRWSPFQIARYGVVRSFQIPRLFKSLSVWENLMVAGSNVRNEQVFMAVIQDKKSIAYETMVCDRAYDILERFDLIAVRNCRAELLSGGQYKLLSLGMALMTSPRLLILDEPMAGIAPTLSHDIATYIEALSREGLSILIVEHNLKLIMQLCHKIVVLHQGQVIAWGTPQEIRTDPRVKDAYLGFSKES